ncbi:NAD(P)/FAD-dependent oxidoreductase [Maioricimonas sp. JC845]|uniref:phytoene desaturase family protein n=1 Tax=Maioricimonas sp. JC845 TaxID=3232138 RepID=UPI0034578F8D
MAADCDAIVIGAGHNGLVCACYLARAGLDVVLLEKYGSIGGMSNTEEVTLPGYHSDTHAICIQFANFSPVPDELGLAEYGYQLLRPDPCWSHAFPDGQAITVFRDIDRTCQSIARFSQRDAETWRSLYEEFLQHKDAINASLNSPPPSFADQAAQQQAPDGPDHFRLEMQSLRSWCHETFEAEETRCLASAWGVHVGAAPDDVGGGSIACLFSMVVQHFGNNVVKGGMRNLPLSLAGFLEAHNGSIRVDADVKRILIESGRAVGVQLDDGGQIRCRKLIASSAHPRHLVLDLLGEDQVGPTIARKMRLYEVGEPVMVIYLALDRPPEFKAGSPVNQSVYMHPSGHSLEYYSRIFSDARGGLLTEHPFALVCNDVAGDPGRAPAGKGLMKLVVQPLPWHIAGDAAGRIKGTNWDEVKEPFADRVIEQMTRDDIPNLADSIVKRVVHSPVDIARLLPSAVQGTNTHGATLPYQVGAMRPIPELGGYRSPIDNVYLCGAGSHPGPGVTMAPGRNAAQVIYDDLGLTFA